MVMYKSVFIDSVIHFIILNLSIRHISVCLLWHTVFVFVPHFIWIKNVFSVYLKLSVDIVSSTVFYICVMTYSCFTNGELRQRVMKDLVMLNQGMWEGFVWTSAYPGGLVLLLQCLMVQTCLAPSPSCGATAFLVCTGTSTAGTYHSATVSCVICLSPAASL